MKRLIGILLSLCLLPLVVWGVTLLQFNGEVLDGQTVELRWRVDTVQGVAAFEVERSTDSSYYQLVGERVPVSNALEYVLQDRPGLASSGGRDRMTDIEQAYFYRLYYILPSGDRQPAAADPIRVSFQFSTVTVTWGSIKAMFR